MTSFSKLPFGTKVRVKPDTKMFPDWNDNPYAPSSTRAGKEGIVIPCEYTERNDDYEVFVKFGEQNAGWFMENELELL